jgi:cytidylate kinase
MQIISISRGSQNLGLDFAHVLSDKLGFECVSREDLLEEATHQGIPIGKLETAIVKPHIFSERLALELEHYKALATSILCEKALDHNIVYHGRTGHLLLPGIENVLRIRVVSDMEQRIAAVMNRLNLPRRKAQQYIEAVEEDRRRWIRKFYNVEWDVFTLYDLVLNLSQVSAGNAATAVCTMVQLPEFQPTPASTTALRDLLLAANARLMLLRDERTHDTHVKVMASRGTVYVTYSFMQADKIAVMREVLEQLPEARQVVFTKAQTNLLWIQEAFDVDERSYANVLSLANTWDAAVQVIRLTPEDELTRWPVKEEIAKRGLERWRQTGIIDDSEEEREKEPDDLSQIYERLISSGRAGGKRITEGTLKSLLKTIDRSAQYRLIVLDNICLSKSKETRTRLMQEWSNTLSDSFKTPVVSLSEIQKQYRFGKKQTAQILFAAVATALMLFAIFKFDTQIIAFLQHEGTFWRSLATACVVVFVPTFAFIYGTVTSLFLRLIKLD